MNRELQIIQKPKRDWKRWFTQKWRAFRCFWGHEGGEITCYHKRLVECKVCGKEVSTASVSSGIDTLGMFCVIRTKSLDGTDEDDDLGCTSLNCPRKR